MNKIKAIFGYIIAALGIPLVLATLIGMQFWMQTLVNSTGIKVSPNFTGGEVRYTIDHQTYKTEIHETVFAALIGESSEGFVQIKWSPRTAVPQLIDEIIDYNQDGTPDFQVKWDRPANQASIQALQPAVLGLEGTYQLKEGPAIRVKLKNQ
jgi:hypothetical protein